MGTLRTLFALSVVFSHANVFVLVGGRNAVQLFYIISGFLISYVLLESKAYSKLTDFYTNRFLRLYPIYLLVALLTLLAVPFSKTANLFRIYSEVPLIADLLLVLTNLFLFGQDWLSFLGIENNKLVFSIDFLKSDVVLNQGLIVPQAWTLGVELCFYLIAPFVLPKRKLIYLLLAASISIRIYFIAIGIGLQDPWTYRFFPTELALFLLGSLAHQVLLPYYSKKFNANLTTYSRVATYIMIFISMFYFLIPINEVARTALLFVIFIVLIPFTFFFQNTSKLDKWIGDLSYPIYIGHILIIMTTSYTSRKIGFESNFFLSIVSVILSILFAIFLNMVVGQPVEKLRNHFRKSTAAS